MRLSPRDRRPHHAALGEQGVQRCQKIQVHDGHSEKRNILTGEVSSGMHCMQEYTAFDAPSALLLTCYLAVSGLRLLLPGS